MEEKKKKNNSKKTILLVIGILLVVGTLVGGNLRNIADWSTSESIGYNTWTLLAIFGGAYMAYLGVKK